MRKLLSVALMAAGACAGQVPHTQNGAPLAILVLRPVEWNTSHAPLENVRGVVDDGNVVAVFSDDGARILSSGALIATDSKTTGGAASGVVSGADGTARWIMTVDAGGHLHYLHNLSAFEDVSARYGLEGEHVRRVASLGDGAVAFLLDHEIAIAADHRVTRYAEGSLTDLAAGDGLVVGVTQDALHVIHAKEPKVPAYALLLPGVTHAAVGKDGRLYASTSRALYTSDASGALSLVYVAEGPRLHGLVTSGDHVWFADGAELGVIEGDKVAETRGANLGPNATLLPSESGDVWALEAGALRRFQSVGTSAIAPADWNATVAPVFARACASCHTYGGIAGLTLATEAAWRTNRAAILARVVMSRTMPPKGHTLTDADRAVIVAWVTSRAAR